MKIIIEYVGNDSWKGYVEIDGKQYFNSASANSPVEAFNITRRLAASTVCNTLEGCIVTKDSSMLFKNTSLFLPLLRP